MPPIRRLALFGAAVAGALALSACDEIVDDLVDSIDGSFDAEACCHFEFWRNDTLLVRNIVLPAEDETEEDPDVADECLSAQWRFVNADSWLKYEEPEDDAYCSDDFTAEIHIRNEYFEVVGERVESGSQGQFAEGWWKLHIIRGDIDDIVDGGVFLFWLEPKSNCDLDLDL